MPRRLRPHASQPQSRRRGVTPYSQSVAGIRRWIPFLFSPATVPWARCQGLCAAISLWHGHRGGAPCGSYVATERQASLEGTRSRSARAGTAVPCDSPTPRRATMTSSSTPVKRGMSYRKPVPVYIPTPPSSPAQARHELPAVSSLYGAPRLNPELMECYLQLPLSWTQSQDPASAMLIHTSGSQIEITVPTMLLPQSSNLSEALSVSTCVFNAGGWY